MRTKTKSPKQEKRMAVNKEAGARLFSDIWRL